jgi:hypothetical protein
MENDVTTIRSGAFICAALFCLSTPALAAQSCATGQTQVAAPAKPKKKGFGLGGILKAANQAGVGNLLTGGMLGSGAFGQVAGAVAGTAVSAASGDGAGASSSIMGSMAGLSGSHRVAQVAGAVTGTAANLARSAPRAERSAENASASSCSADVGAVVNRYK